MASEGLGKNQDSFLEISISANQGFGVKKQLELRKLVKHSFSSGPEHFGSHGLLCRYSQVQKPHRTQPVPKMAQKKHEETSITKTRISQGGRPQVPEELCQEAQQEEPEEEAGQQCQDHECMCGGHQGPYMVQGGQAQDPKGWQLQVQLNAYTARPMLGKHACAALSRVSSSAGQSLRPRLKARPRLQMQLRLPKV